MKAIRAKYENGAITPIEPVPESDATEVLVIFPETPRAKETPRPPGSDMEAELFGSGKEWWTDEVDAAVRESFVTYKRSWEDEGKENNDASL